MSTAVLTRPTDVHDEGDGGAAARRAVIRWAWRLFRREWRQQVIVLALVVVAVAATVLGAAIATNTPPPADAGFGSANHLVSLPGTDRNLRADLATIQRRFGTVDVIESRSIATGLVHGAVLRAQNPHGAYGRPMLRVLSGRYPRGAGEVAMTGKVAATFGVHVGGVWRDGDRDLRVVGLVENPQNLLDDFALLPPGRLSRPSRVTVLFDATAARTARYAFPLGATAVTPHHSDGIAPDVLVLAIAVVGLIFVGLVAVAGFTMLAQRRSRALGMLSSLGATDRNVRLVMIANGAFVGVGGAVIGAVLGLGAWIGYAPRLAASAHHRIEWPHLPWWLVGTVVVLAVVTATLASRRPARAIARVPVVAALSGRPAAPKGVHRSAVPGIVLLGLGPLLLAFSGGWSASNTPMLLGGLLACVLGLLLLAPLAVALLGMGARFAPAAIRIALRDLSRYRARSGAALAATSLAVLIAMFVALLATGRFADPVDYFGPNLAADQVLLYTPGNSASGNDPLRTVPGARDRQASRDQSRLRATATAVAATLGAHDVLALETATVFLGQATHAGGHGGDAIRSGPGTVYVATPALLARYGISPHSIDPRTLLLTSRPGLQGTADLRLIYGDLQDPSPTAKVRTVADPKIQTFNRLPTDTSAPNLLVTSDAVQRLGLQVSPGGWLIQAPKSLSALQVNAVRQLAAEADTTIEVKNDAPSLSQLRNYATVAGILLALGVLAMTVGLIRSETTGELRTLSAVGASSYTRRTITAATAGALGLLGAVLGTAVAYGSTAAFFRSELGERMSHVPVADLVLILVGLPAAAAAGGWLFAGRQPTLVGRRPLE